jgi:hypothetical protein
MIRSICLFALCCAVLAGVGAAAQTNVVGGGFFGDARSRSTATYSGPADVVASPILFYGLRPVSLAYATATGKLANIVRASDSHACDVLAATTGGMGLTANCGTGGDNGQSASAFCNATTCAVATLYDQSGANACSTAACDLTQATSTKRPALTFNCVNTSLPCMTFNGTSSILSRASSPTQAQPFTYSSVWNVTGACTGTFCVPLVSDALGNYVAMWIQSNNLRIAIETNVSGAGVTANNIFTLNTWNITQAIFNSTSSILNFNGTTPSLTGTVGTHGMANSLNFGSDTNDFFNGPIVEVGVWGSGFNGTQQSNMCHNQYLYWGTSTSC